MCGSVSPERHAESDGQMWLMNETENLLEGVLGKHQDELKPWIHASGVHIWPLSARCAESFRLLLASHPS
jgi:hypothetical protein